MRKGETQRERGPQLRQDGCTDAHLGSSGSFEGFEDDVGHPLARQHIATHHSSPIAGTEQAP